MQVSQRPESPSRTMLDPPHKTLARLLPHRTGCSLPLASRRSSLRAQKTQTVNQGIPLVSFGIAASETDLAHGEIRPRTQQHASLRSSQLLSFNSQAPLLEFLLRLDPSPLLDICPLLLDPPLLRLQLHLRSFDLLFTYSFSTAKSSLSFLYFTMTSSTSMLVCAFTISTSSRFSYPPLPPLPPTLASDSTQTLQRSPRHIRFSPPLTQLS